MTRVLDTKNLPTHPAHAAPTLPTSNRCSPKTQQPKQPHTFRSQKATPTIVLYNGGGGATEQQAQPKTRIIKQLIRRTGKIEQLRMITLESFISITSHRCSLINLDDIIRKQREIEVFNDKARKHSVGETVGWEQSLHKLLQDIGVHADLDQHFSQFVTPSPCLCIAVTFADKVSKYSNYVVGIDISRYACLNAKKHSGKKCDFVVCDAENLPFQKEVFSTVIILAVLHHLPNVANALAQFNRVLRCKGAFILNEPGILNPFMMIGRHLFFKGLVTSDETPFVPSWLEQQVSRAFTIQKINHRYFMSQLMPLFLQILPDKSLRQHSLKASYMVDCQLLRVGLNQLCWSFNIVGKKQ